MQAFPVCKNHLPNVLILENELIIAADLVAQLGKMGLPVQGMAHSVEAAMQKIHHAPPDLLLMDVNLEDDFSGVEAAYRIRTHYAIPILFVSAMRPELMMPHLLRLPQTSYLCKPFSYDQLWISIKQLIRIEEKE